MFTGMRYFVDLLGINYSNINTAFNFLSGQNINFPNIVYSESWATGASSGRLNQVGNFFQNSGTGFFNGSTFLNLSNPFTFGNNATILFSYEKRRPGNEILMSSISGNSFNTYSGFCIGVNDANKLYFKYWNPVEGPFTFVYSKVLSDKNLMIFNRNTNNLSIGRLNSNTLDFDLEQFNFKNNSFRESDRLILGGMPNNIPWVGENLLNFSGYFDDFYIFQNLPFEYRNYYVSGLLYSPTGVSGSFQTVCYTTGYIYDSGFSYSGVTGYALSPYLITGTGITGYGAQVTGFSYSGITGYANISLGFFNDACKNTFQIFTQQPLSGLITSNFTGTISLTGLIITTGYNQVELTGLITGSEQKYFTGEKCETLLIGSTNPLFRYNSSYLNSLSFSEISLFSEINVLDDLVEIYYDTGTNSGIYNKNLNYDIINSNNNYSTQFNDNINSPSGVLLYLNGQIIVNSGFNNIVDGYNNYTVPNLDYYNTGNLFYMLNNVSEDDNVFYDYFTGNSEVIGITGWNSGEQLTNRNFNNAFVFLNGEKLLSGIDYTGQNTIIINIPSGNHFIFIKNVPNFQYLTGNNSTLRLLNNNLKEGFSQVYFNGIKQKLFLNYIENSIYDMISGNFYENNNNFIIYNNTNDFFV